MKRLSYHFSFSFTEVLTKLVYANSTPGKFNAVFPQTDSMKSHKN